MSDTTRQAGKNRYKGTLNLPRTRFPMRANLVQREPRFQKHWDEMDLYARMRDAGRDRPRFVLHDGPPYANGPIHMGHLLNKVLKDFTVRARTMLGFDAPFQPGWDCHGLPIEHKVVRELGERATSMEPREIRRRCRVEAEKFVKLQSRQMRRLGTIGDYGTPYITMSPDYEASTLEVFARLVEKGLVYRALRPVHWSVANRTALAEAELEYRDREDVSVYVLFEVSSPAALPAGLGADPASPVSLMIWTTTPWTLPANLAVAVHPDAEYGLYRFRLGQREGRAVVARALEAQVFDRVGATRERIGACRGEELAASGASYRHPFVDRRGAIVTVDYVTLEDGTGLVHTAPGHGAEDFYTGRANGLEIYCPVLDDGTFDETVPEWLRGRSVWEGNERIVERLRESGSLFHDERFTHSYPHDWRSKTPTIFRATEQWFIGVDHERTPLRRMALDVTAGDIVFHPAWGRARMRGMLEARPDWCISRQRSWGLPIPAFFDARSGRPLLTAASVRAVARKIRAEGSDAWFTASPPELLADYDPASDPQAPEWLDGGREALARILAGQDIFDVWFESGSSWNAVVAERGLGFPADLYLEGSDQHRGWFQLSLLAALGATGSSPFKEVLTHGFMVDKHGRKMSKSLGNTLDVEQTVQQFGADVCRWWVCSLSFDNDVKVDSELFALAGEEYRKVRNTLRFLLSNLEDFDPGRRRELTPEDAHTVDAWAAHQLAGLVRRAVRGYETYRYRQVHESVFRFCNETLSAVYLAAVKDRLYCDGRDSARRRRTQTVLYDVARALVRLIAPVVVHTAEEAWLALAGEDPERPGTGDSVHLQRFPEAVDVVVAEGWDRVMALRTETLKALEEARETRGLANPLDAGVRARLPEGELARIRPFSEELADLCGVSRFTLEPAPSRRLEVDDLRGEARCERSWKRDGTVRERSDGGWLSDRDADAVGV